MGVGSSQGLTRDQILTLLGAQGLGDVGTFTLATLPDPAENVRRTVWVSDLWSTLPVAQQGGRVVSEGGFWKPVRPLVTSSLTFTADMVIQPFSHPTTLIGTGALALGTTRNLTLGTGSGFATPYPGYRQRIVKPPGVLGVLNLIGATTIALSGWADYEFDGAAWRQTASGGLL
jgi:hypothetical protein